MAEVQGWAGCLCQPRGVTGPPIPGRGGLATNLAALCCIKGRPHTPTRKRLSPARPGVAIISMDMYNDGTKVIDDNFDGGLDG